MTYQEARVITDLIYKLFEMQRSRKYYLDERTVRMEIQRTLEYFIPF